MLWAWLAAAWAAGPNLVLVTLDTTRADALSCYGSVPEGPTGAVVTPHLDQLAADGARFTRAIAHAPTTLSSHASMLTGRDPHGHAVVRNGFALGSEHPTLATRLAAAGWDTVAVVGSAALERAMGLDRGFRVYDDAMPDTGALEAQRRADAVVDRALGYVDDRPAGPPLFLWVHVYDPHAPYDAPEPFRDRFTDPAYGGPWRDDPAHPQRPLVDAIEAGTADPAHARFLAGRYLGEVAFVDDQVGRLLDGLADRGLLDHTVVIVAADHGETLTEWPTFAWSHGSEVGWGAIHVPLIVRGFGVPLAEHAVVEDPVGLSGIARTAESLVGLPPTLGDGYGFADLLSPGPVRPAGTWPEHPVRPIPVEATRPRQLEPADGWNNLVFYRAIFAGGWGAYAAPVYRKPLRYYESGPAGVLPILQDLLAAWDAMAPAHREPGAAPETTRALEVLGYVEPGERDAP